MSEISKEQIEKLRLTIRGYAGGIHPEWQVHALCDLALKGLSAEQPAKEPVAWAEVRADGIVVELHRFDPTDNNTWWAKTYAKPYPYTVRPLGFLPSTDPRPSEQAAIDRDIDDTLNDPSDPRLDRQSERREKQRRLKNVGPASRHPIDGPIRNGAGRRAGEQAVPCKMGFFAGSSGCMRPFCECYAEDSCYNCGHVLSEQQCARTEATSAIRFVVSPRLGDVRRATLHIVCDKSPEGFCRRALWLRPHESVNGVDTMWQWDGNVDSPTITPSIDCKGGCGRHFTITKGVAS